MKKYHLQGLARENRGEYVLGSSELKTHACYCVYGVMRPQETGRTIRPGTGHEEIICLVQGTVALSGGRERFILEKGEAFYLRGEEQYTMDNTGDGEAQYVISGGHSEAHEHQH